MCKRVWWMPKGWPLLSGPWWVMLNALIVILGMFAPWWGLIILAVLAVAVAAWFLWTVMVLVRLHRHYEGKTRWWPYQSEATKRWLARQAAKKAAESQAGPEAQKKDG